MCVQQKTLQRINQIRNEHVESLPGAGGTDDNS